MYEWGEVKKVPGNKMILRSILKQCGLTLHYLCSDFSIQSKEIRLIRPKHDFWWKQSDHVSPKVYTNYTSSNSSLVPHANHIKGLHFLSGNQIKRAQNERDEIKPDQKGCLLAARLCALYRLCNFSASCSENLISYKETVKCT